MKAFDEIMGLVRRYAPTLTAHLLLLVWLSLFVLDTSQLPDGATVWALWSGDISKVLKSAGIDAKTWYLAAGLALAYVTLFQWLCRLVTSMPYLQPQIWAPYDADLLSWACEALRLKPDPQAVAQALDYQVKRALERVRQTNQSEPYQHLIDQRLLVTGWYGNALIFLTIIFIWRFAGAPYASSSGAVDLTLLVLLAGARGLGWYAGRLYRRERAGTAYWVLEQVREPTADSDPLAHERRRAITQRLAAEAPLRKKLDAGLTLVAARLAPWRREGLAGALGVSSRAHDLDWQVLMARWTRHGAVRPRASALDPASFERQFTSLLEREGSGLAVLTPALAGLALAGDGGSVYSFLTRRHEHSEFGVSLKGGERLDAGGCRLCLQTGDSEGFIAALGPTPIAKLVAGVAPDIAGEAWRRLRWDTADAPRLGYLEHGRSIDVDGTAAGREAALVFGDSYLLGLRTANGLAARAVLQAFRIVDGDRVLIAWCILDAEGPRLESAKTPPWWSPRLWLLPWMVVSID